MPKTFTPRCSRQGASPAVILLTGASVVCLIALLSTEISLLLAEDAKPAPTPVQEETKKPEKPPPPVRDGTKSTPAKAAKPSVPAGTPAPALSFNDFDLEKYHKEKPVDEAEEETEEEPVAPVPPPPAGAARPAAPKAVKPAKPAPAAPKPRPTTAPVADEDPLKPFRDREAREKIRTEQIQTMRSKLSAIQARLDYLQARRRSILDPLAVMPKPPSDATASDDSSLKPKELVAQIDAEIKGLQEEREQAQDELAAIETRFAQESTSR